VSKKHSWFRSDDPFYDGLVKYMDSSTVDAAKDVKEFLNQKFTPFLGYNKLTWMDLVLALGDEKDIPKFDKPNFLKSYTVYANALMSFAGVPIEDEPEPVQPAPAKSKHAKPKHAKPAKPV